MKVIRVDNYDRGIYEPVVIKGNLTENEARRIADRMNNMKGEYSPDYYIVVEDDWQYEF